MFINHVQIYGNLTRDPEFKALPSGTNVVNFSIATNRKWKAQDGQMKEEVEFHNVVAFGKTAELINQYMRKGSGILIEGRIKTRSWDATDGSKRYRTEIITESMQFGQKSQSQGTQQPTDEGSQLPPEPESAEDIDIKNIPF